MLVTVGMEWSHGPTSESQIVQSCGRFVGMKGSEGISSSFPERIRMVPWTHIRVPKAAGDSDGLLGEGEGE